MKSLDLFVPWVAPYVYGAPEPLIRQMLIDAAIEYCGATHAIQTVTVQSVVAGEPRYDLESPAQQKLSTILGVFYRDRPLLAVPIDNVHHGAAVRAGEDTVVEGRVGTPEGFYQVTPGEDAIYLWPRPDTDDPDALAVRAAFEPARNATSLADRLYDSVYDIAAGAIARLLSMPGQAFTNAAGAERSWRQFQSALASGRMSSTRGDSRAALRVTPRPFA